MHAMSPETFLSIDSQILYLLVPNKIQVALSVFQRAFQEDQRIKMENKSRLEKLLEDLFRKEYLRATNMTNYGIIKGVAILQPGEHIAVYDGSVYHHGIYMGIKNEGPLVLDNCAEKGINGKSIQYRKLEDFIGDRLSFDVIECKCPSKIMEIAELFEKCDYETVQTYDLIKWNCECFAWTCATHGFKCDSEQARKITFAIIPQVEKVMLQVVTLGSKSSSGYLR
jgi:hypothetical protein